MTTTTNNNPGRFTSWHMERAGDNRYSDSDSTKQPAAGTRSKTLVTDGRPAGTYFKDNPWFDGGAGNRGARAHELSKYTGSSYAKQSTNDAPFMKGNRARTEDGTLREIRSDAQVANVKTLQQRAPELVAQFGNISVGELQAMFGGLSVSKIGELTQGERASILAKRGGATQTQAQSAVQAQAPIAAQSQAPSAAQAQAPSAAQAQAPIANQAQARPGSLTAQIANIMQQK